MVSFFFSVAKKNWEYSERQITQRRQNPYLESSSSSSPTLSSSERKATYPLSFLLSFLSKTSSSRSAINTAYCYYCYYCYYYFFLRRTNDTKISDRKTNHFNLFLPLIIHPPCLIPNSEPVLHGKNTRRGYEATLLWQQKISFVQRPRFVDCLVVFAEKVFTKICNLRSASNSIRFGQYLQHKCLLYKL